MAIGRRLTRLIRPELALCLAILAACSGVASAPDRFDVTIRMLDNSFDRPLIEVPVGATVTFVGAGHNPHNAVASDGSWSTETVFGSLEQAEGDVASIRFEQPGEYTFFCTFHGTSGGGGMAGRLLVGDVNASAAAQGIAESTSPRDWTGEAVEYRKWLRSLLADALCPGGNR